MSFTDLVKILWLAAVLSHVSNSESRGSLVALAWTLRNREKHAKKFSKFRGPGHSGLSDLETVACRGSSGARRFWQIVDIFTWRLGEGYCRSLAIASTVWCGEEADPTAGSTHFHRHDDWPEWALNAQPVALIGSWFFYNQIDLG